MASKAPPPSEAEQFLELFDVLPDVFLFDAAGAVSGLAGILRPFDHAGNAPQEYRRLTPAIQLVTSGYERPIRASELANACGLSVSQLQREFRCQWRTEHGSTDRAESGGRTYSSVAESRGTADRPRRSIVRFFEKPSARR